MWRILLFPLILSSLSFAQIGTYLTDNSDWWSFVRVDSYGIKVKPGNTELEKKHFGIGGSTLGSSFETLMAKFGKAAIVSRGDAASGRQQICYEASKHNSKQHLVFEFGEVEETFYLFQDGPAWTGQELCTKISSTHWVTPSGLKLGITRSQVEKILGPPDATNGDRIVYVRETKRKTSPEEFARLRKDYPRELTDKKAHEWFDFVDLSTFIDARFSHSKLIYLAVSKTETD